MFFDVERLDLKPTDILVVRADGMTPAQVNYVEERVRTSVPGWDALILVLNGDADISTIDEASAKALYHKLKERFEPRAPEPP